MAVNIPSFRVLAVFALAQVVAALSVLQVGTSSVSAASDGRPVVYLTFDDGPGSDTPKFLDLLASHDIKATFFVTGRSALNFPDLTRRVADEGHAIGNHTYDHSWLTRTDPSDQLARGQDALGSTLGTEPTCYRPPYGATNDHVRSVGTELGMVEWLWDLDTEDWRRSVTAEEMVSVLNTAATAERFFGLEGAIVLMHDGGGDGARTVEALATWLETNNDRYDFRLIEGCGSSN